MGKRVKIYVYPLEGKPEELKQKAQELLGSPVWHWVADLAELRVAGGLPTEWGICGAIFSTRGELRWWRRDGTCEALLLSEEPLSDREPLPGDWECTLQPVLLQNLEDRRVRPNFAAYPDGRKAGYLEVRICFRDGMAVFVSPRQFVEEE